jgi:hypothetical protein
MCDFSAHHVFLLDATVPLVVALDNIAVGFMIKPIFGALLRRISSCEFETRICDLRLGACVGR